MKDRITALQELRRNKQKKYNQTPSYSWKKKLIKIELDIVDSKIKMELLKKQYR